MSEITAMPVQSLQNEYIGGHGVAEQEAAAEVSRSGWRSRIGQIAGRAALALGIAGGMTAIGAAEASPAEAASVSCYGDYCSGQYANETGCDEDAETIAEGDVYQEVNEYSLEVKNVTIGKGGGDRSAGKLELRWSKRCGTAWARLNTSIASGASLLGVQKDDGYSQSRKVGGLIAGSPSGTSYTPMVYGRGTNFRAFITTKDMDPWPPYESGTLWTEGKDQ